MDFPDSYGKGLRFCRGDTIKVRVPISGTPTPKTTWSRGREVIDVGSRRGRADITGTNLHTTMIIEDCVKADEGSYTLLVENKLGSISVDLPIHVVGEFLSERERERERQTERERERQRDRERERETERQRQRQRDRERERVRERQTERQTGRGDNKEDKGSRDSMCVCVCGGGVERGVLKHKNQQKKGMKEQPEESE